MLARLVFVLVTALVAAGALVTSQLITPTRSGTQAISDPRPASAMEVVPIPQADSAGDLDEDEVTDVYGNEITTAVAKYKFDATGTLYELHSPQTEIPRLAPPKS